jgi:putative ABC transport system substrate-binding protein
LAAELVRLKVDVIVPWFTPAAIAAKQATREIPIVCAICGDLVATGLVESLARPGGNVTGNSSLNAELSAKFVELIREMVPSAHRVAVLANAPDPFSKVFVKQIQLAGEATGTAIDPIMIHTAEELDAAFPPMERSRPDAVIVQPSLPTQRAAELALSYRIPAICGWRQFVHDGGLMAYFAEEADIYRRAAIFVDKILKGAKPAELPVEQPTKFELVLNLKTAKAIGLTIPAALLARVDEVIE